MSTLRGLHYRVLALLLMCGMTDLLGACGVPKQMRVDTGVNPKYQDKDVRFRTTYYFRVFDYCADVDGDAKGIETPFSIDSLYRFRMTGKASSLSNQVHFESGTLTAGQIDPLGANVSFDKKKRQFYFKSQQQVQREAARSNQFNELDQLMDKYQALKVKLTPKTGGQQIDPDDIQLLSDFRTLITQQITEIKGEPSKPSGGTATTLSPTPSAAGYCKNLRRGFQIIGPEGWRTFNQDDRLILAMSSSGKPLISTMKELSGRVLDDQPIEAELLLPLIEEDLRLSRTERVLDRFDASDPEALPGILDQAITQFNPKTEE